MNSNEYMVVDGVEKLKELIKKVKKAQKIFATYSQLLQ